MWHRSFVMSVAAACVRACVRMCVYVFLFIIFFFYLYQSRYTELYMSLRCRRQETLTQFWRGRLAIWFLGEFKKEQGILSKWNCILANPLAGFVWEWYRCQILGKFIAVPFTRNEHVSKCHKGRRTAVVCEGKSEEVAEGWRKLRVENLVSCSFHPQSITENMRLVVDDKYLHNCSRETRNEETADKTQQCRVFSGLSETHNVTSCSEICWLGKAVCSSAVMNF